MHLLVNYTETEQQRAIMVQHLTAEVLDSIWSGLSKEASKWKDFYFAIEQFPEVIEDLASPKYNRKFIQI